MPEDTPEAEFLAPIALHVVCDRWLVLDALVEFEDEIIFACLDRW